MHATQHAAAESVQSDPRWAAVRARDASVDGAVCAILLGDDPHAGKTASYSDIAKAIGAPRAVRAVAQACAANALAVAIPCHRVVRTNGDPAGYRWGVERKRALLARESRP